MLHVLILTDGNLFCSMLKTDRVQLCRIQKERTFEYRTRVILSCQHEGFDIQMASNDKRLATALLGGGGISGNLPRRREERRRALACSASRSPVLFSHRRQYFGGCGIE